MEVNMEDEKSGLMLHIRKTKVMLTSMLCELTKNEGGKLGLRIKMDSLLAT